MNCPNCGHQIELGWEKSRRLRRAKQLCPDCGEPSPDHYRCERCRKTIAQQRKQLRKQFVGHYTPYTFLPSFIPVISAVSCLYFMRYGLIVAALLWSIPASAQPIHGHPQKAAYASPAEWPELFDGQMHWDKFDPLQSPHCVHLIPKIPYGAELKDDAFDVSFTMKLFHCPATVTAILGEANTGVTWDNGVTLPIKGKPAELLSFTGKVRVDPKAPAFARFLHKHGWVNVRFAASVVFDNGDIGYHNLWWSYYSVIDLTAPETIPPGNFGPILSVRDTMTKTSTGTNFGDMVLEVEDWLPLLPINKPWFVPISAYNYTSTAPCCPDGLFEQRRDFDFHAGNAGKVIISDPANQQGFSARMIVLDPATMTNGPHKDGVFWKSSFAGQTISTFLAFAYSVGDSVPPPPLLCTDPKATNVGQPLPCVYPLPPMCSWNLIATGIRVNSCDAKRMQLCATSDPASCQEVVFKP